ncbi:MAG: ankyrin repeat domain-containing protein, partial [Candidatus Latescibacterota bacterium]|nr:ankyrin repeat domain-containing protein [Candidatus Latescibacterota bacterium]
MPQNPDLRHLKKQAAELLSTGSATSVADSQYQLALEYGFTSWPKLKAHVESAEAPSLSAVEA